MVKITLTDILPSTVPDNGWIVGYRKKGTTGAYIIPIGSPFDSDPIEFTTTDPAGTLYEGYIKGDCGFSQSVVFNWVTPCDCIGEGYDETVDGSQCVKTTTIAATVTNSGYCLAASNNGAYSNYGSRIYNPGFTLSTIMLPPASVNPYIFGNLTIAGQWSNPTTSFSIGPMNREAVWIDSDCDGNRNSLTNGVSTTLSAMFNNTGGNRTIFMGVGADNQFKVVVNGVVVVDTLTTSSDLQFKLWHIIPINIIPGINYVNVIAVGDGSANDAMAMVIYDNTASQIYSSTSDAQLNILYKSSNVRGTTYDIATCPSDYSLDASGGSGNYMCTKTEYKICNSAS